MFNTLWVFEILIENLAVENSCFLFSLSWKCLRIHYVFFASLKVISILYSQQIILSFTLSIYPLSYQVLRSFLWKLFTRNYSRIWSDLSSQWRRRPEKYWHYYHIPHNHIIAYLDINPWHIFSPAPESPADNPGELVVTPVFTHQRAATVTLQSAES